MLPAVAVEIAPADAPPSLADALLASCTAALRSGACTRSDAVDSATETQATAVVVWNDGGLTVRMEVGVKRNDRPIWVVRKLDFKPSDAPIERWRAAGLTIASLMGEMDARESPAPALLTKPTRDRRPVRSADAAERGWVPRGWLGLSVLAGPGLTLGGGTRLGGRLEGALSVEPTPIFVLASVDHAVNVGGDSGLDVEWTTLSGSGALVTNLGPRVALIPSAGALARRTAASAAADANEKGTRWDPGVTVGTRASYALSSRLSVAVGVDGWRLWRGTTVRLRNEDVGRSSAWGIAGWLGVQWGPNDKLRHGAW